MELPTLVTYVKQALVLVLWLSLPAVLTASIVGLGIAFLQAVTQVQDQSIAFGIKLIAAIVAIAVTAASLGGALFTFADTLFGAIENVR
jgi:type III secretion protein S